MHPPSGLHRGPVPRAAFLRHPLLLEEVLCVKACHSVLAVFSTGHCSLSLRAGEALRPPAVLLGVWRGAGSIGTSESLQPLPAGLRDAGAR